jgi:hypothetical protein
LLIVNVLEASRRVDHFLWHDRGDHLQIGRRVADPDLRDGVDAMLLEVGVERLDEVFA